MAKTKREVVQTMIDANIEDCYKMEIVRDANKEKLKVNPNDHEAKVQIDTSVQQIMKNQQNIVFLEAYIKTCA
jgi:folate-dependent phosphoribosylglycinamide formyltransferase PurN